MTATSPKVVEPPVASPRAADELGWRWPLAIAAVAIAVTVATRFIITSPLWLDEALSVNIAKLPLGQIPGALRADGHPPLYYWLLHLWMDVFGSGDRAVRALSGAFSVATLPLAYKLGRDLAGRRGAIAALVLMSASPYCIRYGTEARMYSMIMFLVLLATWALRSALTRARPGNLAALALLNGTLLLTHYWSIFLMVATIAVLLVHARHPQDRRRFLAPAVAIAVGGLALVPWLGVFLDQRAHTGTPWAPPARPTVVVAHTVADL
ncbi:MAG: hypothetical protein JWL70_132, partial [Acidimicrobiia bacterium]|nr:hypothetical protein [Acidimicrobiia bacterium]